MGASEAANTGDTIRPLPPLSLGDKIGAALFQPFALLTPDHVNPFTGNIENFNGDKKVDAFIGMITFGLSTEMRAEAEVAKDILPLSKEAQTLFHYTNEAGLKGITESGELLPSLKALSPKDARFGDGQYMSNIAPGTRTPSQLSYDFLGMPFQGSRFTHFLEIDVTGLPIVQGRSGVFVNPSQSPLDLSGRIVNSGVVPR